MRPWWPGAISATPGGDFLYPFYARNCHELRIGHTTYFVGCQEWGWSVWAHNVYTDDVDIDGTIKKSAADKPAEVERELGRSIDLTLAQAIARAGANAGYDGDTLHTLATTGRITPTNAETFHALARANIHPDLAEAIATESANPPYDAALVRELADNGHLSPSTVIDILSLGPCSGSVTFPAKQLQKKYNSHAADFGVTGNYNPKKATEFQQALEAFIANPNHVEFPGTYKMAPQIFILDPRTAQMVMLTPNREFLSAWNLGNAQATNVRYRGRL